MLYYGVDPASIPMPKCPCCQEETNDLYESEEGEIVGCPSCLMYKDTDDFTKFDAWEWWRELQENEYENHRELMRYEV